MGIRTRRLVADLFTHAALVAFSLAILLPILWVVRTSVAEDVVAYELPPRLLFRPTLKNYVELFTVNRFGRYFVNSLLISVGSTVLAVPIAALGGYAFQRYRVGGRPLEFGVLSTQMLPGIVLILPLFTLYTKLRLVDNVFGIVVAYLAFNLPFLIWLMMGFFEGIPRDLEEAALIDGCSPAGAFFRIIFPVAAPGIMSAAVLSFIMCWNEFLFALILTGAKTSTVPVAIAAMQTNRGVLIGKLSAGTTLAIIPMIVISFFVQKYLVRGLTFGAIK
ncbi:MAG: carbohydrate ABC transporter permease [Betaproteobacteria bacterium]